MCVDEYNCIWCEGTGCSAPTKTARSLVSFFQIFRYSKSAIFFLFSTESAGTYTFSELSYHIRKPDSCSAAHSIYTKRPNEPITRLQANVSTIAKPILLQNIKDEPGRV